MDSLRISTRETGVGERRLSIDLNKDYLIITEMVRGLTFLRLSQVIWVRRYQQWRDAYLSLKSVPQGIVCVNDDYLWEDENSRQLYIRRIYLARKGDSWTMYELVGRCGLDVLHVTTEELDKIIESYDSFLNQKGEEK